MNGLRDYSGTFNPKIRIEDFSKDTLGKLAKLYSKLLIGVDGFWYLAVKENLSDEMATACDLWAWDKYIRYEISHLTRLLNIKGTKVVSLLKAFQFSAWLQNCQYKVEAKDDNFAVLTIAFCPTLSALEREGEGREKKFCESVEPSMFKMYANYFNPDIEVRPLKLPPRKSKKEICCQWEFRMGQSPGGRMDDS